MARRWHKVLLAVVGVAAVILAFLVWYRVHFSMEPARSFEVQGAPSGPRVLIATQGSQFKNAVVAGLVDHLKGRHAQVKVADISTLASINVDDWNAIVLIHTWEMRKPPVAVESFIDRMGDRRQLVVLTTSGAGNFKMEGVDAISAASRVEDVPARVAEMSARLDAALASPE